MGTLIVAAIVFACSFGGALLGIGLRRRLPASHLDRDAKDVVTMATGLLAGLVALVLGLMIASAKSAYDAQRDGFKQLATNLVVLDRSLRFYGPETMDIRENLRRTVLFLLEYRWPGDGSRVTGLDGPEITHSAEAFYVGIRDLAPRTEAQKAIQVDALRISEELARTRWLLSEVDESSFPTPFLVVLIFWLAVLFISFGLFSPRNGTMIALHFVGAVSLAAAMFLILELDRPFSGLIQISNKPLHDAVGQLGK